MKVAEFLKDLRGLGIELRLDEQGALVCNAPKGTMTAEVGDAIRRHKEQIVAFLKPMLRDKWSTLVPIQPCGSALPFFCFHGVGGNVLNYSILSQYLGDDQPLYGLQSVGLDGTTPPLQDIGSMTAHYTREIKSVQPHGPYHFGGGSMGGLVAYEMAQQFRQAGEEIGLLILFDTIGPNLVPGGALPPPAIKGLTDRLADMGAGSMVSLLGTKLKNKKEFLRKMQICRNQLRKKQPIPIEYRFWFIEQMNFKAMRNYEFKPYDGQVVLIRGDLLDDGGFLSDPLRGWSGLVRDMQVQAISGQHETLIEQPALGETLAACLREAQRKRVAGEVQDRA